MSTVDGHIERPRVASRLRLHSDGGLLRLVRSTTLLLVALAVAPASAGATFPGHNGRIAWAYDGYVPHFNPGDGINTLASTGFQKAERRIVGCLDYAASDRTAGDQPSLYGSSCGAFWHVSWSANGRHLVWANVPYPGDRINGTPGGNEVLVLANRDGSGRTTIAHAGENDFDPSFSPDGKRLLYVRSVNGGPGQIVTSDLTGNHVQQITTIAGRDPEFSPDGRRILFIKGYSAWIVGANGRGAKQLITHASNADWSPNGRSILIVSPYHIIRTYRSDGANMRTVRIGIAHSDISPLDPSYAVFSPDGKSIAFSSDYHGDATINVVPSRGGNARTIDWQAFQNSGEGSSSATGLSWQPQH